MEKELLQQNEEMQRYIIDCLKCQTMIPVKGHVIKILQLEKVKTYIIDGITYVKNPFVQRLENANPF